MITEQEKLEILRHEWLVKELTESFEEVMQKMIQDDPTERCRCMGHPSQED